MTYAKQTTVTVDRSKTELEKILAKAGADQFAYMADSTGAIIAFRMQRRHVRFSMPMPDRAEFLHAGQGAYRRRRSDSQVDSAYDQAIRTRWRALVLIVKAKLEAVESGVSSFEREFLADIMLPDGGTVHEFLEAQIEEAYSKGAMPNRLQLALPEKT